jgi:hypothetical protein
MGDIWQNLSETTPDENQGSVTEDLPARVWALGTTATKEDGGWAPDIRMHDTKIGRLYKFEIAFNTLGGEKDKVDPKKHRYARTPLSAFIHSRDDKEKPAPQLVGLLNALFSAGVGAGEEAEVAKAQRWQNTLSELKEVADLYGLTLEQADDDPPKFLAMCAKQKLEEESYQLLIKPSVRKYTKRDGTAGEQTQVSQFEDATVENQEARNIVLFEDDLGGF